MSDLSDDTPTMFTLEITLSQQTAAAEAERKSPAPPETCSVKLWHTHWVQAYDSLPDIITSGRRGHKHAREILSDIMKRLQEVECGCQGEFRHLLKLLKSFILSEDETCIIWDQDIAHDLAQLENVNTEAWSVVHRHVCQGKPSGSA